MFEESGFWPAIIALGIVLWVGSHVTRDARGRRRAAAIAAAAFAAYIPYGLYVYRSDAGAWLPVLLFATIVAAFTLGFAWIALPGLEAICQPFFRAVSVASQDRRMRTEQRQRETERHRREEEARRQWEEDAPARERAQSEAEVRHKAVEDAKLRRDRARAQCELLYALHAPEIGNRFSRQDMERFFSIYMTERHSVDEVERRAGELQRIITEHRQAVKPIQQQKSIEEIVVWYKSAKATIDNMDVESNYKSYFKSQLEEKFAELSEDALRKSNL